MQLFLRPVKVWSLYAFSLFLLLSVSPARAQISTYYTFSQATETYTAITGGTALGSGMLDDYNYSGITIPFTFNFNGVNYTSLNVNTNGYVTLGATLPPVDVYGPISNATGYSGAICALGRDLQGLATGEIRYQTLGTSPTRVFVVQWKDFRKYNATGDQFNFQIKMYESTGVIKLTYGTFVSNATNAFPQVGLRGSTNTEFKNRQTSTNWVSTVNGVANASACSLTSTILPSSGLTFIWSPPSLCTGTPTGGTTVATVSSGCYGFASTLSLSGATSAYGIVYQWQYGPTSSGPWTDISGAVFPTYIFNAIQSQYYRCNLLCAATGFTGASAPVNITVTGTYPVNQTIPYSQDFESWSDACSTHDVPGPGWGTISSPFDEDANWRRDDEGSIAGWTSPASGVYTPASYTGSHSARFHSFWAVESAEGSMDLHIDMSPAGAKSIDMYQYNTDGNDYVAVYLSEDGNTFVQLGSNMTFADNWTHYTFTTSSTAPNAIIRIKGVSDFGDTDMGIDNFSVTMPCTAGTVSATTLASQNPVCPATAVTFSLSGTGIITGLTDQWQSSPDGSTWTNISGATSTTYNTTPAATTWYRCALTCTASSTTVYATPVQLIVTAPPAGDIFANPIVIGTTPYSNNGDNLSSNCWTSDYTGANTQASPDVFYKYVASCNGTLSVSTCGSSFDTWIHLLDGSGTEITGNNDDGASCSGSSASLNYASMTAGNTYYIVVEGNGSTTGNYSLSVTETDAVYTFYSDTDGDGYGNISSPQTTCVPVAPTGTVANSTDCNDGNSSVNPSVAEICNGIDDNCDGTADNGLVFTTWYVDADLDNYGTASSISTCDASAPAGYAALSGDCSDVNAAIHPFATEVCNSIDDNCNGSVDDGASISVSVTPSGAFSYCIGATVTLSATSGYAHYQWFKDGVAVSGAHSSTLPVSADGSYYVNVVQGSCFVSTTPQNASSLPAPKNKVTVMGDLDICAMGIVKLTAAKGSGYTYLWYKDGVAIAGGPATHRSYTATTTGSYYCRVTNGFGCIKNSQTKVVTSSCRNTPQDKEAAMLSIFPNPASGDFMIDANGLGGTEATIFIFDDTGKKVFENNASLAGGNLKTMIHLENSPSGIYLVTVISENGTYSGRVIIAK